MDYMCYFYKSFHNKEDIYGFLSELFKSVSNDEDNLVIKVADDEDDGDYLEMHMDYVTIATDLYYVNDIAEEQHITANFGLSITVYDQGAEKFWRFISRLLENIEGDLIILEEFEKIVLERRHGQIIANEYYFKGKYEGLEVPYLKGIFKNFSLSITTAYKLSYFTKEIVNIAKECFEDNVSVSVMEYPDMSDFDISTDFFKVYIRDKEGLNGSVKISMWFGIICPFSEYSRAEMMMKYIKEILIEMPGDCEMIVQKGYLEVDFERYDIMKRHDGVMFVNIDAEEKCLFDMMKLPYEEREFVNKGYAVE